MNGGKWKSCNRRQAFTLLELTLALGLSIFVFAAIGMAIDVHLRALESGRADVEEAQLARTLLGRIAEDVHGALQYDPIDAETMLADVTASSSASSGNAGSESSGSSGSSKSGSSGSGSSGSSSGGGSASGKSSTGSGSSSGSSSSGGSGSSSASDESSSDSSSSSDSESSNTEDLADSVVPKTTPGLYGNANELQVDVSRLPRADQQQAALQAALEGVAVSRPSDVKTVTYFVNAAGPNGGGLYRREMNRAEAAYAAQQGSLTADDNLQPIAPEVAQLTISYSDGTQWLTEWDTESNGGLPKAVEIAIDLRRPNQTARATDVNAQLLASLDGGEVHEYRLVVFLPSAHSQTSSQDTSSASGQTTSTSGSSSGSSSQSSSGNGSSSSASGSSRSGGSSGTRSGGGTGSNNGSKTGSGGGSAANPGSPQSAGGANSADDLSNSKNNSTKK